jgi:hypothetical protein
MFEYNLSCFLYFASVLFILLVPTRVNILPLIFIAWTLFITGFRYAVGTDYFNYKSLYYGTDPVEPIFRLIIDLFNNLSLPYEVFLPFISFIICSVVIQLSRCLFCSRELVRTNSQYITLYSITVIFSLFSTGLMGTIRSTLAFSIFFLIVCKTFSNKIIDKKHLVSWLSLFIIPSLIHYSMITWTLIFVMSLILLRDKPVFCLNGRLLFGRSVSQSLLILPFLFAVPFLLIEVFSDYITYLDSSAIFGPIVGQVVYKMAANATLASQNIHSYIDFSVSSLVIAKSLLILAFVIFLYTITFQYLSNFEKKCFNFFAFSFALSSLYLVVVFYNPSVYMLYFRTFAHINRFILPAVILLAVKNLPLKYSYSAKLALLFLMTLFSASIFYAGIYSHYNLFVPYSSIF